MQFPLGGRQLNSPMNTFWDTVLSRFKLSCSILDMNLTAVVHLLEFFFLFLSFEVSAQAGVEVTQTQQHEIQREEEEEKEASKNWSTDNDALLKFRMHNCITSSGKSGLKSVFTPCVCCCKKVDSVKCNKKRTAEKTSRNLWWQVNWLESRNHLIHPLLWCVVLN